MVKEIEYFENLLNRDCAIDLGLLNWLIFEEREFKKLRICFTHKITLGGGD